MEELIKSGNVDEIASYLQSDSSAINQIIQWGPNSKNFSHPLHFLCDVVFGKYISEEKAIEIATLFFQHSANVDGQLTDGKDTPIIAACSLLTDQLGLLYLSKKPNLNHRGVHGGTCLHWAAYTGSSVMVKALLEAGANPDRSDNDFNSSPLGWAIHAAQQDDHTMKKKDQLTCIQFLANAGADQSKLNFDRNQWPEIAKALQGN